MKKSFIIVFLIIMILNISIIPVRVEASIDRFSWNYLQSTASNFLDQGTDTKFETGTMISDIANILVTIGVVIVLAGFLIIGIKYMTATPQEAAKLKSKLIGLIIAGVVILGSYAIWMFVGNVLNKIA